MPTPDATARSLRTPNALRVSSWSLVASTCLVLVAGTAGCDRLRNRTARVGPRANLELVRVDDEANPLGTERPPPLEGMRVDLAREQHASQAKARLPTTFARFEIPLGPGKQDAITRAKTWLDGASKPADTRFALGEEPSSPADEDQPPTTLHLRSYLLKGAPAITTTDIFDARVDRSGDPLYPMVMVTLSPNGTQRFAEMTRDWRGRRIAILVDGMVMSAPLVMSVIDGGRVSITVGGGPRAAGEAKRLAESLRP